MGTNPRIVSEISLAEFIRERIRKDGPVPFDWFMEQALYHPELGYYSTTRQRIGRAGDFYTNVSVGALFGGLLASQLLEMREQLGAPMPFTIVEQGAEEGQLAADILSALRSSSAQLPADLKYIIVEPHPAKERQQRLQLCQPFNETVSWVSRVDDLKPISGVFISNELIDAFPVKVIEYRDGAWSELYVEANSTGFEFVATGRIDPSLEIVLDQIPIPESEPYRTEINLPSATWISGIAPKLVSGFLLTVDYGFSREEYYKPERTEGTLTAYSRHRRIGNPLLDPGQIDLTSQVDFTFLAEAGMQAGLTLTGFTDQHHFMVGAAEARLKNLEEEIALVGLTTAHSAFLAGYRSLMHPGTMGMAFKYLLMTKSVASNILPSGFRHARNPHRELGLT
jgi:SAM-dependent MidA family methyltransferase